MLREEEFCSAQGLQHRGEQALESAAVQQQFVKNWMSAHGSTAAMKQGSAKETGTRSCMKASIYVCGARILVL